MDCVLQKINQMGLQKPTSWAMFTEPREKWLRSFLVARHKIILDTHPLLEPGSDLGLHSLIDIEGAPLSSVPPYSLEIMIAYAIGGSPSMELALCEIQLMLETKYFWFRLMGEERLKQQVKGVLLHSNNFLMARVSEDSEKFTRWKLAEFDYSNPWGYNLVVNEPAKGTSIPATRRNYHKVHEYNPKKNSSLNLFESHNTTRRRAGIVRSPTFRELVGEPMGSAPLLSEPRTRLLHMVDDVEDESFFRGNSTKRICKRASSPFIDSTAI